MPVLPGQVVVELRAEDLREVLDALVEVFDDGVEVVHVEAVEGIAHGVVSSGVGAAERGVATEARSSAPIQSVPLS